MTTGSKNSAMDAIVVMGGGLLTNGNLPNYVVDRCDFAIEFSKGLNDVQFIASSCYSLNVAPKKDMNGFIISEATTIRNYIKSKLKKSLISCEQFSHDTVGSIFLCLLFYGKILGFKRFHFVTSDFHAQKTNHILEFIIGKVLKNEGFVCELHNVKSNFASFDRRKHELESVQLFDEMFSSAENIADFTQILLHNHSNYNHEFTSKLPVNQKLMY